MTTEKAIRTAEQVKQAHRLTWNGVALLGRLHDNGNRPVLITELPTEGRGDLKCHTLGCENSQSQVVLSSGGIGTVERRLCGLCALEAIRANSAATMPGQLRSTDDRRAPTMAYGKSKMPNEGGGSKNSRGNAGNKTNTGATGGLRKSNEMRGDVMAKPDTKNRYPRGMS